MLKKDMAYLDADNDPTQNYQEKIETYERKWNKAFSDPMGSEQGDMLEVLERENPDALSPNRQFEYEPFTTIERLMIEHDLDVVVMRQFLNWRSRKSGVAKRRFKSEPFTSIERLMTENKVDSDGIRKFLNWKSRKIGAAKRKRRIARKKASKVPIEDKFFSY